MDMSQVSSREDGLQVSLCAQMTPVTLSSLAVSAVEV